MSSYTTLPRPKEPTNSVPLSPQAICRAASTPEAQTSILKPGGSLIFLTSAASSASEAPVGGPEGGANPFCASVSSPRNQSSGGWVQNSLVPDSYFFSGRFLSACCALAAPTPATMPIVASARTDRWKADFIASLPLKQPRRPRYLLWTCRETCLRGSDRKMLAHPPRERSAA